MSEHVYLWWLTNRDGPLAMAWSSPMREWLRPASDTRERVRAAIKRAEEVIREHATREFISDDRD